MLRLTNDWWLVVWMFTGGIFIDAIIPKKEIEVCERNGIRWRLGAAFLLALPYILWAGTRGDFGDTNTYRTMFSNVPDSVGQISAYLGEHAKDKGFTVMMIVFKSIFGNEDMLFFLFIAIIQMGCVILVYRKYSVDFWTCMFLFVASTDYLSWMHNGIRQFLAATIIFACFGWIVKKRYIPLIAVILLASTIHGSALIMIPIVFLIQGRAFQKRTLFGIFMLAVIMIYMDQFTGLLDQLLSDTQYATTLTDEIWSQDNGTSILRVLVYSIPTGMAFLGRRYIAYSDDPVIHISTNAALISTALYAISSVSSGIYFGRLPIYVSLMSYMVIPWVLRAMFFKSSERLVKACMMVGYLLFFYVQMHFGWNIL